MSERPRKTKKQKLSPEDQLKAAQLERELFGQDEDAVGLLGREREEGSLADVLRAHAAATRGTEAEEGEEGAASAGWATLAYEDRAGEVAGSRRQQQQQPRRRPAWEDPADAAVEVNVAAKGRLRKLRQAEEEAVLTGVEYEQRLRQQHNKLHPRTSWASLNKGRRHKQGAEGEDSEEEGGDAAERLLMRAGGLLAQGSRLAPGLLEVSRMKDANQHGRSDSVVRSVEFHPRGGGLLMTAGLDRQLRFFEVDGLNNKRLRVVFIKDLPIHKAAFVGNGGLVLASGRRKHFYLYDVEAATALRVPYLKDHDQHASLETFVASTDSDTVAFLGGDGCIPLFSLRSRDSAGSIKMNGTARSGAFSPDGQRLLTSGGDGIVYEWDLRMQRCLHRYADEGCLNGTSLACSSGGAYFATGSNSGVVNVYDWRNLQQQAAAKSVVAAPGCALLPETPLTAAPLKSIMNLTTSIDSLAFNPDSQVLAIASRLNRDSLRLVHLPSLTVFSNWPTAGTPLHYVHSMAFSPGGGYLAIGNARGRVLLYRLHHYAQT